MSNPRVVVGIDVGTTKTCALIAEVSDDEQLEIKGVGLVPSRGMRKGVIVYSDDTVASSEAAVQRAEQQSGFKIVSAFVGISGSHIASQTSPGVVGIRHPERQITSEDVQHALEAARAVSLPGDREVIHVLPRHYVVDGQEGIKNPVGMLGHRIEVQTTVVSGSMTAVNNLVRCVERAGVGIDSLVLQVVAAGEAVLTDAERDLGVVLIDIGGGTTDVGVFGEGALLHAMVLPVGGYQVSNDISVALQVPFAVAEDIKIQHGYALAQLNEQDNYEIELPETADNEARGVTRRDIGEIIEPRMEEIFLLVGEQLEQVGFHSLPAGVVLSGGSAQLGGLRRLAAEIFDCPVRLGSPSSLFGLSDQISTPAFGTSVGLLRWGLDQEFDSGGPSRTASLAGIGSALSGWLRNFLP